MTQPAGQAGARIHKLEHPASRPYPWVWTGRLLGGRKLGSHEREPASHSPSPRRGWVGRGPSLPLHPPPSLSFLSVRFSWRPEGIPVSSGDKQGGLSQPPGLGGWGGSAGRHLDLGCPSTREDGMRKATLPTPQQGLASLLEEVANNQKAARERGGGGDVRGGSARS